MRPGLSDSGSQGNSDTFDLHPGSGNSPNYDHGCNVDGSKLVGGWGRTWIIELISLFLVVVLSAGSAVSLLVQVEDGEREDGGGGGGIGGR
jgi:hypothetical protein